MAVDTVARALALNNSGYSKSEIDTMLSSKADIVNGTVPLSQIPPAAIERIVTVANDTARFALTTDEVQLGDTVKVTSTNKMYFVIDTDHLDGELGYQVYVAGKAAEAVADQNGDTIDETYLKIKEYEESAAAMNSAIQENARKIEDKVDKVAGKGLSTNDYTNEEKTKLAGLVNFFTQGTSIPENSDLDEYKTPGVYFVWQKPTADTLANCPVSSAFRMEVTCLHLSNRYVQRIYAVNFPEKFFMRYTNDATTWQKWYQFSGTAVS